MRFIVNLKYFFKIILKINFVLKTELLLFNANFQEIFKFKFSLKTKINLLFII